MLGNCVASGLEFEGYPSQRLPFEVAEPGVEILDELSARLVAEFRGPSGSQVIGRAWISDADGTMVDGETGVVRAGNREMIELTIPRVKVQNGDLIACMRVEWPHYQTKHVIKCTLVPGKIVHPPKGKQC